MHSVKTLSLLACLSVLVVPLASAQPRELTIWLIPFEPASNGPRTVNGIQSAIEEFNRTYGKGRPLEVLNTTDDTLRQQLLVWNRVFNTPNWNMIAGQQRTLKELLRFTESGVRLRVLFVDWGRLLSDLDEAVQHGGLYSPDVAVVGSTWVAWLASRGLLTSFPELKELKSLFRDADGQGHVSLHYTRDIRLLFYWKRFPFDPSEATFAPDTGSWKSLIESFARRAANARQVTPPMVFQAGFTQNLLHDYVPLLRSGGAQFLGLGQFRTRVDLSSPAALSVPLLLATNAIRRDKRGWPYRLMVFPEQTHEESAGLFMNGEYSATIEPLAFLKRWYDLYSDPKRPRPPGTFWDYAGVAALPASFLGGSDIVVFRKGDEPPSAERIADAQRLAQYLVSDTRNQDILAGFGNLPGVALAGKPSQISPQINEFLQVMPTGTEAVRNRAAADIRKAVETALGPQGEYPEWAGWPVKIENRESLEAMQALIRRMGEGNADGHAQERLTRAARDAEHALNIRLDVFLRAWEWSKDYWLLLVTLLIAAFALILREQHAYAKLRKVRGPAAVTLLATEASHVRDRLIRHSHREESREQARKALMVRAAIRGWRRGLNDVNWNPARIEDVIGTAIVVTLESLYAPELFSDWEKRNRPPVEDFLRSIRLARSTPEATPDDPPFFIKVDCPTNRMSPWPFMLEQAIVCLVQNAIQAARAGGHYKAIHISYDKGDNAIRVVNEGGPLSARLRTAINFSPTVDRFEKLVLRLLDGHPAHRPGIGLIEAFCIARHCYGGLKISSNPTCATLYLDPRHGAKDDHIDRGRRPRTRLPDAVSVVASGRGAGRASA